jgi:hypothetical protein
VQNTTDILEGLHVLLVSEDEQRTQALGKVLRERRANVGNLKISSRDPIALRGADVLVIDTRSAQNTQGRVNEMRADVRARWASVVNLDFAKVAPDVGALQFALLENAVGPVTAADRALTERARKETSFTTELLPLGPTRILRALGMAGTTLQVEFTGSHSKASLTLSNELLVSCFLERNGTRWEAWKALARVLGLSDASVTVSRLQHPSAMNIMEPLDQALQTAAQERHASAAEIASEEPSSKASTPEPSKAEVKAPEAPKPVLGTPGALGAFGNKDMRVQPGRTIMGIAPTIARPAPPAAAAAPAASAAAAPAASAAAAPAASAVAAPAALEARGSTREMSNVVPAAPSPVANVASAAKPLPSVPQPPARPAGGGDLGKPGRTIMGIAPGVLPGLGAFGVRTPAKAEPPAPEPAPAPMDTASTPAHVPVPTSPELSKVAPVANAGLLDGLSLPAPDNSQDRELLPTMPAPAPSEAELHFNELGGSRVERIERVSLGDTPTDPAPPRVSQPHEEEELELEGDENTAVTDGAKIDRLREEAARLRNAPNLPSSGSTLGEDFAGFTGESRVPAPTKPFDASAMARAAEPVAAAKGSTGPLNFPRDESQEETVTMERPKTARRGRAIAVGLLLTLAAGEIGYVVYSRSKVANTDPAAQAQTASATHARAEAPTAAAAVPTPAAPSAAANGAPVVPTEKTEPVAAPAVAAAPAATAPAAAAAPVAAAPVATAAPVAVAPASAPVPEAPANAGEAAATAPIEGAVGDAAALEALIKDGTRLLAEKNPSMAKPLFEAALTHDAKNPHAVAGLGQALLETGNAAAAQTSFETAIKLRPKRARYRVLLGDALKAQGKLEEARAAWEKALEIDPADRDAPKRLGN